MATVMKRHRSRRRVAALTFLSNISLDGTYRDTKLALLNRNGSLANFNHESSSSSSNNRDKENVNKCTLAACEEMKAISAEIGVQLPSSTLKGEDSFSIAEKERSNTSLERPIRKKIVTQPTLHNGSSTESLGGRSRKTSGSISDSSANSSSKELRFIKTAKDSSLIRDERVVLLSTKKVPSYIFTTVPHQRRSHANAWKTEAKLESNRRRHASSGNRPLSTISDGPDGMLDLFSLVRSEDGQDISFSQLLVPSRFFFQRRFLSQEPEPTPEKTALSHVQLSRCFSYDAATTTQRIGGSPPPDALTDERSFDYDDLAPYFTFNTSQHSYPYYSPNLLDDPEFVAGKHRTVMNFASYRTSVIDYIRPSELKKELNDKFRVKFPQIQLTLSKLRSIKREMRKITKQECNIDLLIVAQAFVYFEKLILKNMVNKQNRKLCAGACLMLSAKLNDVKGSDLRQYIEKIESTFRLNRRDLLTSEFAVLVALEFSLHLPTWEIFPLYQRVLYDS